MTVRLWSAAEPAVCLCAGAYRPQLTVRGKLVKTREPAWRMFEQRTRDKGCLQWLCSDLADQYGIGYQHNADSRKAGAGYPDVHLWTALRGDGGGGSAYAELKRMGCDPTPVQIKTMAELQAATPSRRVYLARPCCLLVGAVDELMADLAGVRCRYIEGSPDGPLFPFPAATVVSAVPAAAAVVAKSAVASRPLATRPLPGADPRPFGPAHGYLIPMPADDPATWAMYELEGWLRTAGFSPTDVPYPIRIVAGPAVPHIDVHCRVGLARPGADRRVWRSGVPTGGFPTHLITALHAEVADGSSSTDVQEHLAAARPQR